MASITSVAQDFFAVCETGKGWEGCKAYRHADASFAAQAEPLAEMHTLRDYTEWMKGLLTILQDGRYDVKSFATDEARRSVCCLWRVHRHPHRPGQPLSADRQDRGVRLRLRDAVGGRQDPPHDQDLACRLGAETTRLVAPYHLCPTARRVSIAAR